MAADISRLPEPTAIPGLEILRVSDERELSDYVRVTAADWNPPDRPSLHSTIALRRRSSNLATRHASTLATRKVSRSPHACASSSPGWLASTTW